MDKNEAATHFFRLACASGLDASFMALAPLLIHSAHLSFDQIVQVEDRQSRKNQREIPMGEAFWRAALQQVRGGDYQFELAFFTPKAAAFFNQVCPGFFDPGRHEHDPMDVIANVPTLFADRQHHFSTKNQARGRQTDNGAAWIGAVLDLQPAERFHTEIAAKVWETLLRLPSQEGMEAFLRKRPDAWLIPDEKGRPLIKAMAHHLKAKVWQTFLADGQDPQQLLGGKPFWQAMLPAKAVSPPASDSLRACIEHWLSEEWKAGRADALMQIQLARANLLQAFPQGSAGNNKPTINQAKEILHHSPPCWVWENFPGRPTPAFMVLLASTKKGSNGKPALAIADWAKSLHANGALARTLGEDGIQIVKIAKAIVSKNQDNLPSALCQATLENPHLEEFIDKMARLAETPSGPWLSWVKAQHLETHLSEAELHRPRPRM